MTSSRFPVLEVAVLDVRRGLAAAFIENDHRFLLLVWWDSVESHERGFRGSPQYAEWKALLHHFYDPFPTVEHYVTV
jgi:heme-degrading monooxygenase HmoA